MKNYKYCIVIGCDKETQARNFCWKHLQRYYRHGDAMIVLEVKRKKAKRCKICKAKRCEKLTTAFCLKCHRKYMRRKGKEYRERFPEKARLNWKRYQDKRKMIENYKSNKDMIHLM